MADPSRVAHLHAHIDTRAYKYCWQYRLLVMALAKFVYVECTVVKFRTKPFTVALYPLAKYQEEVKPLHGKRVHVVIIAEE